MGIDIVVAIIIFIAFIKGYRDGFIMSVFTISSYLVGFFAALHFSFVVANYLTQNVNLPEQWVPIISFIILFAAVILIVRLLGKLVEKVIGKLLPTAFNKIVGGLAWSLLAFILLSLSYQLIDSAGLFTDSLKLESQTQPYLVQVNDTIRGRIGEVFPFIQNLYLEIDEYFKGMANDLSA